MKRTLVAAIFRPKKTKKAVVNKEALRQAGREAAQKGPRIIRSCESEEGC